MANDTSRKITENVRKLLKQRQEFSYEIADAIGISRKRFENLLGGRCEFKADDIKRIADFFGKTTDFLFTGIDADNVTVSAELGLSNESVNTLKAWASFARSGNLDALNLLLETIQGWSILPLINKYIFCDFDSESAERYPISSWTPEQNATLLKSAILKAIENELDELRKYVWKKKEETKP